MPPTQYRRQKLYDQVWLQPATKVAASYGITSTALAKICTKLRIPTPGRGYWAKKRFGKEVKRTPLPPPRPGDPETIDSYRPAPIEDTEPITGIDGLIAEERDPANVIVVPPRLPSPQHPLVARAREVLSASKDEGGVLEPRGTGHLGIKVSAKSLPRTLRIMQAVIKALEKRGHQVGEVNGLAAVNIVGETVAFGIDESLEVKKTQPKGHDLNGYYRFGHSRFDEEKVPSGELALRIHRTSYWTHGLQKSWRGTRKRALEERLNGFVIGAIKIAARDKQHRLEEERQAREQEERERVRRESARRLNEGMETIQAEKKRLEDLSAAAERWKQSEVIRAYLEARQLKHLAQHGQIEDDGEFATWLTWAGNQADRIDPLTDSPPSIADEEARLEKEIAEHNERYRRY